VKKVALVGILNLTPDSFSGDGIHESVAKAVARADELFADGAKLVDVGAEATNPWAAPITPDQEWQRLQPVLAQLVHKHPGEITIDSYHPGTVKRAWELFGPRFIVNDVTGMNDPEMRETVSTFGLACIVSHLPARFGTDIKKAHANAELDDAKQVLAELLQRRKELLSLGVSSPDIILDPGIGFGKTMRLNWELLQFASIVSGAGLDNDVLIGYSQKRFLGEHRFGLQANLAAAKTAIAAGASYLRVHDIQAHAALLQTYTDPDESGTHAEE
jgi:dihydropteroate synthase